MVELCLVIKYFPLKNEVCSAEHQRYILNVVSLCWDVEIPPYFCLGFIVFLYISCIVTIFFNYTSLSQVYSGLLLHSFVVAFWLADKQWNTSSQFTSREQRGSLLTESPNKQNEFNESQSFVNFGLKHQSHRRFWIHTYYLMLKRIIIQ